MSMNKCLPGFCYDGAAALPLHKIITPMYWAGRSSEDGLQFLGKLCNTEVLSAVFKEKGFVLFLL